MPPEHQRCSGAGVRSVERVQHLHACFPEIACVSRDHDQAMDERGGRDQAVLDRQLPAGSRLVLITNGRWFKSSPRYQTELLPRSVLKSSASCTGRLCPLSPRNSIPRLPPMPESFLNASSLWSRNSKSPSNIRPASACSSKRPTTILNRSSKGNDCGQR